MLNPEDSIGRIGMPQRLREIPKEFDFRQDFGRRTGKKLIRSLKKMFQIPNGLSHENIIYTIPIEKTLFPKIKQPQDQIALAKTELETSIGNNLNDLGNIESVIYTNIAISGIIDHLALYSLAFGEFPLPEETRKRILRSIGIKKDWGSPFSATQASNYLILGGERFWTDQQASDLLEDLGDKLREELQDYQYTNAFNNGFASTALAYKVLRGHTSF